MCTAIKPEIKLSSTNSNCKSIHHSSELLQRSFQSHIIIEGLLSHGFDPCFPQNFMKTFHLPPTHNTIEGMCAK